MKEDIEKLQRWLKESENVVFFGGAGVSTESGIPDYRNPARKPTALAVG